jgi:purine-binding chemotaxis protein CheW
MSNKSGAKVLVEEKVALSLFLDALLREPDDTPELDIIELGVTELGVTELGVTELQEVEPVLEVVEEKQTSQDSILQQKTETVADPQLQQAEVLTSASIPSWASVPFQVLMFKVAGLTLAVPLHGLNGVVEWTDSLTEMPGHADFYLGILQHMDKSVPVVDTAKLVFPEDKLKELAAINPASRVTRIVLINDGRWGLACDEVAEVVNLTADQVRWRSVRTKRRWLLGTVVDHMCALLDTDAFAEKLITGEE